MKPRLHLLGVPHTITRSEWSHCAFTGKVMRFSRMMQSAGYHVTHYGNEGSQAGADEEVEILSRVEFESFVGAYDPLSPRFVGTPADIGHPLYRAFNLLLHRALAARVEPADVVCFPFGPAHQGATAGPYADKIKKAYFVETGIGYPETFCFHLVYESSAWMHWHHGKRGEANGSNYRWVIPNYYDLNEWKPSYESGQYYAYFGRIADHKGLSDIVEIAWARPDIEIVLCGQGDPKPYLEAARNIRYQSPIWGHERNQFLANAKALLAPSRFLEPFCGVAVEAMLCGTPVLASPFGAFLETIQHGKTGYHCHTLGDWLAAIEAAPQLDRRAVRTHAEQYDMFRLAPRYDAVFQHVVDLEQEGWRSRVARTHGLA